MSRYMFLGSLLVALLAPLSVSVFGQATDGNIAGVITDATGAAIPSVAVELDNPATGVKYNTRSDASGAYRFNNVPVGHYNVTAAGQGFTSARLQNLSIELNKIATANFTLQVGSVSTSVEVTEAASSIDTTTAQITNTYQARQAVDLPISALPLGPINMSLLGAGVASSGGVGLGEGPSVGGQRPRNNSFNVEGVDNNRKDVTGSNLRVPNEATSEVTILQNQFSAEFGHSGGGQFNTLIKGGTNQIHGTLYEYFQNRNLNAVDESFKRNGLATNPRYDQNRLGANAGGAIIKNKLFYFGDFEYNPTGNAATPAAPTLAPTAEGYSILNSLSSQFSSQTNFDIFKKYVPAAPSASGDTTSVLGTTIPLGILPINFPQYQNTYTGLVSVDYNLSDRDQLRGRYIDQRTSGIDPLTSPNLPAFSANRTTTGKLFNLSEFHTFSPSLTNELRFGYNRYNDNIPVNSYAYPGLDVFPNITIENDLQLQLGPFSQGPSANVINTYQLIENLNWNKGRHSLKFGAEGRKYIAPNNFVQRSRGDYGYSTLDRYLLDLNPDVLAERNLGGVPYSGNQINFYSYVNDNFRIRPNLTLNFGLRYEYKGITAGDKLQALNAVSSRAGFLDFHAPNVQKKNFAPRVGLAWTPGRNGLTSIRAGFGIAYDNMFDNFGTNSKPVQLENTVDDVFGADVPNYLKNGGIAPSRRPDALTPEQAINLTSTYLPDQKLPYTMSWNFGVQRVVAKDYTVDVRYLGTRGVHLFMQNRINVQGLVTASRNLPTYLTAPTQAQLDSLTTTLAGFQHDIANGGNIIPAWFNAGYQSPVVVFESRGNNIYHGLATEVTRRFARGLTFKGAYTWSKNIDDSTADLFSTLLSPRRAQDFQNLRPDRSRSFLDRTHRLTFSAIYDTPWFNGSSNWFAKNLAGNWTIAPIYTVESPQYATVQSGRDSNFNGDTAGDRVIVNSSGTDGVGSGVSALKNSSGATVAYLANNPNARYIVAGAGAMANGGRNTLPQRGINNWDITVAKKFNITETKRFEIRAAAFNLFNHAQYIPGSLNTVASISSNLTRNHLIPGNPLFNDPSQVYASNSRTMQVIARFVF